MFTENVFKIVTKIKYFSITINLQLTEQYELKS